MEALPVIFYHQLPVACFNNIFLTGYFGFGQIVWSEIRCKQAADFFDIIGCRCGEANINKTTNYSDLYWIQSIIFFRKIAIHTTCMQQISFKVVSPVVIGTDESPAVAFLPRQQFVAAVSAYIVKSM